MPSISRFKCYFNCACDGPLHCFPKPIYPSLEKFNVWRNVLSRNIQERGNNYIYNQIRLCNKHFEKHFLSVSNRLFSTAVPTLCLYDSPPPVKAELPEVSPASNQDNEISTPNHDDVLTVKADLSLASEQYNVTPTPDNDDGLMEQQPLEEPDEDNQVVIEEDVMEDLIYEDIPIKTEESIKDVLEPDLHVGYKCNMCESEIRGFRYVCVQCSDWDMCGGCEARGAHSQHYVLRLPGARPQVEIQSVLDRIRRELMDSTIFIDERIQEEKDDEHTEDPLNEVQNATEVVYTTSELLDDQLNEPLIFEEVSYLEDFEEEIYIQNDTSDPSVSNITNTPLSSSFSASNTTSSVSSTRVSASINTHSASSATHSVSNTQSTASSARLNVSTTSELSDGSSVSNITNTKLSARLSAPNMTLSALNNTCNYKSSNLKGLRLKKNIFKVTECNPIVKVERSDLMKVMSKLKSSQNLSQLKVINVKNKK